MKAVCRLPRQKLGSVSAAIRSRLDIASFGPELYSERPRTLRGTGFDHAFPALVKSFERHVGEIDCSFAMGKFGATPLS